MASAEPNRVFIWKDFTEWKPALEVMFPDVLTPELQAKARRSEIKYGDDSGAFEELAGCSIDSMVTDEKTSGFRKIYSYIRVYHGCRTEDVSSYCTEGLLLRDKSVLVERFRSIFLSGRFPELTEEILQEAIKELEPYSDADAELCLAADDRYIIEYCGHYLIYGSEYMAGLVAELPTENRNQYYSVLREKGKPTVIEINLPNTVGYANDSQIHAIVSEMLTGWAYCLAQSRTQPHYFDCTLPLCEPLPPKYMSSHYCPRKILDPFMERKIYDTKTGEYEENSEVGN